jgi:hypothetical protein
VNAFAVVEVADLLIGIVIVPVGQVDLFFLDSVAQALALSTHYVTGIPILPSLHLRVISHL